MHLSDCPYQMKVHHYSWTFSAELNSFHYYFQSDWTVSKFIKARKQELKMSCAYTKIPQLNSFVKPVKQSLSQTEKNNSSRARNRPQRLHIIKVHSLVTFIWSCKDLVISETARLPSVWDGVVLHFWMGSPLPEPLGEAQSQATEVSTGEPSLGHLWPGRNCAPILHHLTHEKWSHYLPVPSFTLYQEAVTRSRCFYPSNLHAPWPWVPATASGQGLHLLTLPLPFSAMHPRISWGNFFEI